MNVSDWLQLLIVIVTAGGVFTALRIAKQDRRASDQRAREDREEARKLAEADRRATRTRERERYRLDQALRLEELYRQKFPDEPPKQMAYMARASALVMALGPTDLPTSWAKWIEPQLIGLEKAAKVERESARQQYIATPQHLPTAEVELLVLRLAEQYRKELGGPA